MESNKINIYETLIDKKIKDSKDNIYYIKKKISNGSFGYLFTLKDEKQKKIKGVILKIGLSLDLALERSFYLKLKNDNHPNILKIITHGSMIINKEKYIYMILPKLYYTLFDLLEEFISVQEKKKFVYKILIDMLNVLEFLHKKNIIHADIKNDNIMYDKEKKKMYLIDFNTFQRKTTISKNKKENFTGTLLFAAINAHHGIYTEENDLQSLLFNGLEWIYGEMVLPWYKLKYSENITLNIKNKALELKKDFIENLTKFIKNKKFLNFNNKIKIINYNNDFLSYKILQDIFI